MVLQPDWGENFLLSEGVEQPGEQAAFAFLLCGAVTALFLYATLARLLPLTSQGRHEVAQRDGEVVFLGLEKRRVTQPILLCEVSHHCRCGNAGHPMPVDSRLRIARA